MKVKSTWTKYKKNKADEKTLVKSKWTKDVKKITGAEYVIGKTITGALGIVEGTTDLIAGGLSDLFGNDEYADYVFQYDNWVQDLNQKLDEAYNPGKVGRFVGDVASGLGQSATFLIPGAGQVLFFAGVTGNAVSSASQTTGKTGFREYTYGAMSGTLEAILERYIAGTGQTLETITKSGAKNIASKVVKSYGKAAAKTTTQKMVAAQLISSAVGEGLEEFAGNIGDVGLRRLTGVDKEASINWGDAFYETLVGMTSGGLMGGVSTSIQTAYEAKNGAQINSDAKRRDTMLTQARGLVKMAKEQSLDKGSDAVAARLSEIEASLTAYDNAKDKSGGAANIALGKINQALMGAELNIITDRHAEYIASLSDTELEQLAEYANAYFKDAGVEVTAKDLKDINNQITRALATLDWAGKVVNTMIGTDRILNEEVLAKMEAQQVSEEERAAYQNEQNAKAELERVKTEASENAKPITEGATWNGEAASYHGYLNGAETTLHIEKRNDGAYQAFFITEDGVRPVKLTEEQVKAALAKMTDTENRAEENKSSEGEGEVTKEEKQPETKENEGKTAKEAASDGKETEEENVKASLGADSIPENETAKAKKPSEEYTETAFKATPEEVKAATKAVKQFKLLDAETREAIINMMRSASGIDKVTVQSIAAFMAVRSGLQVRFMKDHRAEGSHDVLTKSGRRLILLDPSKMNGKHWRADIFFHELYHDMATTGDLKGLTKAIYDTAAPSFQHAVADLYTAYYNKGVSISKFLDGKKWTEKNVEAYFDAHNGVSFDDVMEEVAAGTMGRVMGSKKFIRSLRQVGILKRVYYNIAELVQSIANRSITVGGDNTAGFTLTFRDALGYKALYSRAVIESEANLSPEAIAELRRVIEEAAERDEELGTGKKALPIDEQMVARSYATDPTRFSLEFAPRIAERQLALEQNKVPTDILAKAIKDTDAMVKAMLPYSNILPPDKIGKTVVSNGSYDRSIENTTICVRTLAYNEFIDLVQEKLGRPLTAMESFLVSQKLYDIAKEPQCLYCYVSLDRKAYNEMMLRYLNDRDDVIEEWKKSDKSDQTREDMYQRFLRGRKPTANMRENFDLFLSLAENGEAITASDVATEQRRAEIANYGTASQKDQLNKILKYAQSASWAKKQQNYVAYNDEIIKFSPRIVANLNKHYGLRWYSFSDYSGAFIVENMQQITDAALKGLKGLAYTKDTDFVEIFAPSGININISVFVTKGKDGFVIDEAQSADLQKAIELRKKYPNVGIVAVATNDEGVRWALDQEWSDVVIPFHTVRTGADVANFYEWDVYNEQQSDKVENETLWDAYVASTGKKKVSKNIYPSEHHNDRETYLALTETRGLKPRFSEFLDNVNYMKLVNETRQSADETKPLQPIFNLDAAQESFRKFVDKGGYYDGWYFDDVDLEAESAEVASDIAAGKTEKDVEYGRQDVDYETMYARRKQNRQHSGTKMSLAMDADYLDAVSRGDMVTAQKMVDEAARNAGYSTEHLYHGTSMFGFTNIDVSSASDDSVSFFATNRQEVASGYMPWYEDDASDLHHDDVRRIGVPDKSRPRGLSRSYSAERILTEAQKVFPEYKDARVATDDEVLADLKTYWLTETIEAAEKLREIELSIGSNKLRQQVRDMCDAVIAASKEDTLDAWKAVGNRYKEFDSIDIPYDANDMRPQLFHSRILDGLQQIGKFAKTTAIMLDGKLTSTEAIVDSYNSFLGGETLGMYDLYTKQGNQLVIQGRGSVWNHLPLGKHEAEYREWLGEDASSDSTSERVTTRDVAAFAKAKGYRSVAFFDIYDNGVYGNAANISDVYAFFYPNEDVKSADPVTYDDDGNVIPLSERFNERNPDTRYSLSLDSTPEVTVEDVQAEVNRVKWDFEWTDAKLLDNLNAVRRYLSKKYPDNAISLEIDNDQKRVIVDSISRAVDFDAMPYDADFADFLRSIGVEEADIASHLTAFTPSQRQKAGKKLREGEEKAKTAKAQRPRAYYKNQVTTVTNAILSQVIAPMAGGEAKLLGKDKTKLVNWLWRKMNTAKNQAERRKIANVVAEAFIARTIYADYEVNQNYEEMVVSGVIEDYENVRGYLRKIRADSVASDVIARYGEKKGRAVLNRWAAKDGISIGDAIAELQDQGLMTDVSKKNEAELLIALNEEYERLKGLAELRREFVPLALADKATLDDIQRTVREMIMDFFEVGGKETEYARLARRYQELLAEKDAKQQKEIEALEARLNEAFTKRIDRAQAEADRRMAKAKERFDRRLTEANYGREYAKRMNRISADVRSLRDYVNRDYTAADSMEDRQTRGIAKAFLKATTRTGVKPQAAREAARVLLSWAEAAMKDNENFIGTDPLHSAMTQEELDEIRLLAASGQRQTLTGEELKDFGISREKYEAAMEAQKAKESLSLEELEEFHTALKVAIRNYRNYDRFWNGERWVDLNEKASKAVSVVQTANENFGKKGFLHRLGRGIRKIAMPFLDPLSVAAAIDGYNYSGVFQELLTKLAYAEAEKNKMIIELRKPFEEFLKEHPKYQKRLSEAIIELEDGFKITVGQAISLTELNKRDQAKTALAISRIAFRMDDGTVKKLDGFDKLPRITTPNGQTITLIRAQELIKGLRLTRDATIAELKEKGYTENTIAEFEQAVAKAEADAMPLIAQFGEERQRLIAKVEKQLTDDDRAFIKVVSDFFQKTSKDAKTKADIRNLGYTNVIDGYYFPIKRRAADIAKDISDGTPFTDFITTVNLSFNQSIVPNAKASIDVANVWDVVTEHINGLAMWEHLYLPIQNINKIYNKNVNAGTGTTNVLSVKSLLDERTEAKYGAWLKDLLLDVQGARQRETKTFLDKGINTIRGTYAVYQLGFNPQTVVKQTLSWAAAAQYLSPASIAKGITTPRLNAKELDRVSAVAAERMGEATVVKALSNTEKISKIGEKTMWGISKMDRLVNEGLFSMCQHEVATKDPKKPIGSEDNLVEAGKLVSEVILKVQDSSDISTKSQAARSSNELIKAFTMFQSAGLKMFSRIFENVGFVMNYKHMSAEDQAKYGGKYKKAQKQLARSVGSAAAVAVLTAIIVQAFKFIYDKDREDKDGNEITVAEDLATDAATELVGFVPVVGDVVDYFVNGYEMSNFFEDTANDTLKAFSQTFALISKVASGEVIEDWEVGSMLRKVSRAAGSLTGIPVRNVENVLSGLTRRFFPEAGYTYDTLFYRANYTEDINKALKKGDTELAGHILELMIKRGKTGGNSYSDETIEALVELHNAGYDVFPKSPDYEKLDRKSLEQFETVYQEADAAVEKLVKSEAFKAMAQYGTDESSPQASAIKTLYSGFFDLAEHDVLNEEMSRSAAYFTVTDEHNLVLVKAYDKAIKLKTVELKGSRKAMLKAYMKELGMDKTAQAYAAYSCGYRTDDITSVIFNDLKGREDEQELLIALGLIDSDEDKKEDEKRRMRREKDGLQREIL